jgi:hypothetical protein
LTPRVAPCQADPVAAEGIPVESILCFECGQSITVCTCEDEAEPSPDPVQPPPPR